MSLISKADLMRDYENAQLETYKDYTENSKNTYLYENFSKKSEGGLPLIVQRINGKLYGTFTEDTHALVIGATRSGKTTSYIIPTIYFKANQKQKDSMCITDPKCELYGQCANMLRNQGYRVVLVNFRDYLHSECWNPLTPIFRKFHRIQNIENQIKVRKTGDKYYNLFNGKIFRTQTSLEDYIEREKGILTDELSNDIDVLACNLSILFAFFCHYKRCPCILK